MNITLYNNVSAPNVLDKEISQVQTLQGVLHEPSSLIDPTFTIERANPAGFNYFHIEEFGRYYFVTGVSSVGNNLVSVSGHVDVLMTYKAGIRNLTAVIRRQENNFNLLLDDGIFKAYQPTKHKIIRFPNSFNDFCYVLAIAGNGED